jgi:hypothetical protein
MEVTIGLIFLGLIFVIACIADLILVLRDRG